MGMRGSNKTNDKTAEGLRERKRRQTRERISEAAIALFIARGFDATTVDDIAAAADVSKRSFFDYFPTKEDVIFAWQDGFGESLAAAVAERPADEPLLNVIEEAFVAVVTKAVADPRTLAISDLICGTEALRARDQMKYAKLEQVLVDALVQRTKGKDGHLRARLLAMMVIGAMRIGKETWQERQKSESVDAYARRIFTMIRSELREFDDTSGKRR
jgi:AcrR family transcriptional regulator